MYTSERWHEEDQYEVLNVQNTIWKYMLKYVKCCKSEGFRITSNNLEQNAKHIIELGNSHESADLSRPIWYKYHVMKCCGYDEVKMLLADRSMW